MLLDWEGGSLPSQEFPNHFILLLTLSWSWSWSCLLVDNLRDDFIVVAMLQGFSQAETDMLTLTLILLIINII